MPDVRISSPDALDLREFIRAGDGVVWGQVSSEPCALTAALMAQRQALGAISVFMGATFSQTLRVEYADCIRFRAFGGIGNNRVLSKAGVLEVVPLQLSAIPQYLQQGLIQCDVALVLANEEPDGSYSYAVGSDYIVAAAEHARVILVEVSSQAPRSLSSLRLPREKIACVVRTDRSMIQLPPARIGEIERDIAKHATPFIEDGAVLQMGIGAVPEAVLASLHDRRDLGVHSGMIGDSVADLIEAGVVTNARKPFDRGITVTGMLGGTDRLYQFADRNPAVVLDTLARTHDVALLSRIPGLVSINSAVEVDLTGQANAEEVSGLHMGAVGGAVDYVRGAHRSPGGWSLMALPASASGGSVSRIVGRLSGSVSTSRSDIDVVVTEYGAAQLRARSLRERARAMISIAHPDHREALERSAHEQFGRL